jgi:hypothetical protein
MLLGVCNSLRQRGGRVLPFEHVLGVGDGQELGDCAVIGRAQVQQLLPQGRCEPDEPLHGLNRHLNVVFHAETEISLAQSVNTQEEY